MERRHDQVAIGLGALGVRLDVVAILEVLVDDLALGGAHRVERDRAAAPDRVGRRLLGLPVARLLAAAAIPGGIAYHAHAAAAALAIGDLERQMLDGVDGLPVAPDEQAHVLALEYAADHLAVLLDAALG